MLHAEFIHGIVSGSPSATSSPSFHCSSHHTAFSIFGKPPFIALFVTRSQLSSMLGTYYLMFATFAGEPVPSPLRKAKNDPSA